MKPERDTPGNTGVRSTSGDQLPPKLNDAERSDARKLLDLIPQKAKVVTSAPKQTRSTKKRLVEEPELGLRTSAFARTVVGHYLSGRFALLQISTVGHVLRKLTEDGSTAPTVDIAHAIGCVDSNIEHLRFGKLGYRKEDSGTEFPASTWSFFLAIFRRQLEDHDPPSTFEGQQSGLRVTICFVRDILAALPRVAVPAGGHEHLSVPRDRVLDPVALAMASYQLRLLTIASARRLVRPVRGSPHAAQFETTVSDLRQQGITLFELAQSQHAAAPATRPTYLDSNDALLSHCDILRRHYGAALLLTCHALYIPWRDEEAMLT